MFVSWPESSLPVVLLMYVVVVRVFLVLKIKKKSHLCVFSCFLQSFSINSFICVFCSSNSKLIFSQLNCSSGEYVNLVKKKKIHTLTLFYLKIMGTVETVFYFEMGIMAPALYVIHWRLALIPQKSQ